LLAISFLHILNAIIKKEFYALLFARRQRSYCCCRHTTYTVVAADNTQSDYGWMKQFIDYSKWFHLSFFFFFFFFFFFGSSIRRLSSLHAARRPAATRSLPSSL
jgi:hypothetical protein